MSSVDDWDESLETSVKVNYKPLEEFTSSNQSRQWREGRMRNQERFNWDDQGNIFSGRKGSSLQSDSNITHQTVRPKQPFSDSKKKNLTYEYDNSQMNEKSCSLIEWGALLEAAVSRVTFVIFSTQYLLLFFTRAMNGFSLYFEAIAIFKTI